MLISIIYLCRLAAFFLTLPLVLLTLSSTFSSSLFIPLVEDIRKFRFQFLPSQSTSDDVSVWVEEERVWDNREMICLAGNLLSIDDLWIRDSVFLDGCFGVCRLVGDGDAKNLEAALFVFIVDRDDLRNFLDAGSTPRCPEVDEDVFPMTYIVGEARCLSIVNDGEVCKRFRWVFRFDSV